VLSRSRDIQCIKRIESLLKIAVVKFKFEDLEICFHTRQISFLVVKTVKGVLNPNFQPFSFELKKKKIF